MENKNTLNRLCIYVLLPTVLVSLLALGTGAQNPVAGRNVNMVSGTQWPGGDPFLQRQNEPAIAVSSRNPLHLLAGANDYRSVDIPFPPNANREDSQVVGDAWLGVFKSFDGGSTWRSTLLPGYPQDTSAEGLASPIKGYHAGADPVVRAGTNGLFYYTGIAFDRDTQGKGALFLARFIDLNNKENGDPIRYVDTRLVDTGSAGQFLDKPWMAVDIPRSGAMTCTIQVPTAGGIVTQSFPGGTVYVAYAIFLGNDNNIRTKLMMAVSRDCGATWTRTKLSEGFPINQGAAIAIDPATGNVYVAWRQFATSQVGDAILFSKSVDGGHTFSKATSVLSFAPFQQGTSSVSPRINSFPTLAAHAGRVYMAYSEKGVGPGGDSRIVMTTSTDGVFWTAPVAVTDYAGRGHHFMPSLGVSRGRLVLAYYDLREDHTRGLLTPSVGGLYSESRQLAGDLADPATPEKVFTDFLMEAPPPIFLEPLKRRHTLDVFVAEAEPGPTPVFTAVRASQYTFGSRPESELIEQLQFNPPNLKLFAQGTVPFIGDYVDLSGRAFIPTPGGWVFDAGPGSLVAHVVWTDNRDVRPPADGNWANYTPVTSPAVGSSGVFDPGQVPPACVVGQTGMRNQNVYTSLVTEGLYVGSPGNSKPLGTVPLPGGGTVLLQRSFVIFVRNAANQERSYRLSIRNQPPAGTASFLQLSFLDHLDVTIGRRSSISRTVFVTSSDPDASVTVDVTQIDGPGGSEVSDGLTDSVVLNPDITNPDITNPDITNPDITNPDITNAEVYNPDITNPDITNPDITNPDITNPDITNPDITNVEVTNPDITNPDITNPDITNPDITNPDITNPDITNPDITNGSITDTTWTVTNNGNTTAGYDVNLLLSGAQPDPQEIILQLILHRIYTTPVAVDCELKIETHNVPIANIPNPVFSNLDDLLTPDPTNPDITNATMFLAPGESARITLRVVDKDTSDLITFNAAAAIAPVVVAQGINTGETAPRFASAVPPDLIVESLTHSPAEPTTSDTITFTAVVRNIGTGPASASTLMFKIGGETPGVPETLFAVPGLGPGASFTVQRELVLDVAQNYRNTATADFNNEVTESDETNNTTTDDYAVVEAANLDFVVQPSNTGVGEAISAPVQVRARDNSGAVLPGVSITLSIGTDGTNPGGGILSGTTTGVTGSDGIATFRNLSIHEGGSGYRLAASASGATTVNSIPFDILGIGFERYPDGTPTCGFCPVTNELASAGVVFSFVGNTSTLTNGTLLNATGVDPAGGPSPNHSVTAPALPPPGGGFDTGTLRMSFAALPTTVSFRGRAPTVPQDVLSPLEVTAFDGSGNVIPTSQYVRVGSLYTPSSACCGQYRQELITITNSGGISRIEVGMPGYLVFVDNVRMIVVVLL